jgi:hypothetical protein
MENNYGKIMYSLMLCMALMCSGAFLCAMKTRYRLDNFSQKKKGLIHPWNPFERPERNRRLTPEEKCTLIRALFKRLRENREENKSRLTLDGAYRVFMGCKLKSLSKKRTAEMSKLIIHTLKVDVNLYCLNKMSLEELNQTEQQALAHWAETKEEEKKELTGHNKILGLIGNENSQIPQVPVGFEQDLSVAKSIDDTFKKDNDDPQDTLNIFGLPNTPEDLSGNLFNYL